MDKEEDTTELIKSIHNSADTLESLIRDGRVPDTPPVEEGTVNDYTAKITSESYEAGFDAGYRARKRDAFVPSLLYALAGLIAGLLGGVMI